MSDFFRELETVMPLAREIASKALALAGRTEFSVAARAIAIQASLSGVIEASKTLTPEGSTEQLLRDVGGKHSGGRP
jgi:hypothetical protein